MIREWLEEWFDTFLYIGIAAGMLFFFLLYWKGEYKLRYAELVMQDFLTEVSSSGKITLDKYEAMVRNLKKVNAAYEIDIQCMEYELQPVYALVTEDEITDYYVKRNVRKEISLHPMDVYVEEETEESLKFQQETNASVMAAADKNYIPLPEETDFFEVNAVRPFQEVYEGEELITICSVSSSEGNYYAEAEAVTAQVSGTIMLQLRLEEELYQVPLEIVCYPRKVVCENGHEIVNSRTIILEYKKSGNIDCPYCKVIPAHITCNVSVLQKETGTKLSAEEIWITVVYLDGHIEQITPEEKEWQDSYDENYCGIQQVVISYRGKEDTVTVVAENGACLQCGKACNERCFEDYCIFPYCTECMSKVSLFTGEVYEDEQWKDSNEVVAYLDKERELLLRRGDFVVLLLWNGTECISLMQETINQAGRTGEVK